MPIPTEFSRSIQSAVGVQASIALGVPASNVAWLINHIAAQVEDTAAAGSAFTATVEVLDGATKVFSWEIALGPGIGTAGIDMDVGLLLTPGNQGTIRFAAGIGGVIENLLVRGTVV